jgi:hydroxymethylbilane synthase
MKNRKIVIGTRGSRLALWQAEWVKSELEKFHPGITVELNKIKTTGDKILDVPLAKVGGKGLFVKEIEEALLRGEADIAVHSMKDVPTEFPEGLHLAVICKREDPRDAFITGRKLDVGVYRDTPMKFGELRHGATIGTSSLRRSCQLLHIRPDLRIEQLRGNLDTRIKKLDEGQFDAIILAAAGVKRLGWADRITEFLSTETSLPAIGQGAVGIECRIDDEINDLISPLNDHITSVCVRGERVFLKKLEGVCQVPIAAYARIEERKSGRTEAEKPENQSAILIMEGLVGNLAGDIIIRERIEGAPADAALLGLMLAERLLSRGAKQILDEVYARDYGKDTPKIDGDIAS